MERARSQLPESFAALTVEELGVFSIDRSHNLFYETLSYRGKKVNKSLSIAITMLFVAPRILKALRHVILRLHPQDSPIKKAKMRLARGAKS
jgi:hypothetical protein